MTEGTMEGGTYADILLDSLTEVQAALDRVSKEFQHLRLQTIPPEVQDRLAEIDAEALTVTEPLAQRILDLTEEIKSQVLDVGSTVKGSELMAVYNKGRVSWDTKALEGFAAAYPELLKLKSVGKPTVTIRRIGDRG